MPNVFSSFGAAATNIARSPTLGRVLRSLHCQVIPLHRIADGHRLRQAHRAQVTVEIAGLGGSRDGL